MKKFKKIILLIIILAIIFNIGSVVRLMYPFKYENYIRMYAQKYNLDPYLVASVIKNESKFDRYAKSNKDAYGLMQLTPETAKWIAQRMGIGTIKTESLYDAELNIAMGCWYLSNLMKEFGNIDLVLAAYNAGRGNVNKWLESKEHSKDGKNLYYIPYKETDKYVKKVNVSWNIYKVLYDKNESKIKIFKCLYYRIISYF